MSSILTLHPDERRRLLIDKLARELFRYDQGYVYDAYEYDLDANEEFAAKVVYVTETLLPLIQPYLHTGRIVHGDDLSD